MTDTLFPLEPTDPALTVLAGDGASVKLTKRRNAVIARGYHPMGPRLREPAGETCGTCRFAVKRYPHAHSGYWKCELCRANWTQGPGSDIRLKWPACDRWEARA